MADFTGKRALVTGGASGLGRATAKALVDAGAEVVIADIDREAGEAVAAELGGPFVRCDVSSLEENMAMVEAAGDFDLAYLNAGVSTGCGVGEDFSLERYRRAMGANLDGVVFGTHAVLPVLKRRGGAIVATASLAGLTAVPFDPLYAANKHAVVGLARSLGPALAADGVRFNAVCPGFAESKIIEDIREAITGYGVQIIPAERVAETVLHLFGGDMTGECWFIQDRREAASFQFRNVPGPGTDSSS